VRQAAGLETAPAVPAPEPAIAPGEPARATAPLAEARIPSEVGIFQEAAAAAATAVPLAAAPEASTDRVRAPTAAAAPQVWEGAVVALAEAAGAAGK
jgi:hypothetical protein